MPLAIDFGTSNTVAALWDANTQDARSLPLADLTVARIDPHGKEFHVVPSLMHFHERGQRTGQQVAARDLLATPGTFRWMKSYNGSGMKPPRTLFVGASSVDGATNRADVVAVSSLADEDVIDGRNDVVGGVELRPAELGNVKSDPGVGGIGTDHAGFSSPDAQSRCHSPVQMAGSQLFNAN